MSDTFNEFPTANSFDDMPPDVQLSELKERIKTLETGYAEAIEDLECKIEGCWKCEEKLDETIAAHRKILVGREK